MPSALAMCEVIIIVAVSEDGQVKASVQEECRLIQKRQHEDWLKNIREDNRLWSMKTIRTLVPMPIQYEDATAELSEERKSAQPVTTTPEPFQMSEPDPLIWFGNGPEIEPVDRAVVIREMENGQ